MKARLAQLLRLRSGRDGFIIVAVLWILAALATLVMIFSVYVINTATAFTVHDERLQAEGLARAALELSAYQASAAPQGQMPARGTFLFRLGNALVNAEFMSETARIDLNSAPKELLSGLFAGLGASRSQADGYADRILGWRSPPPQDNSSNEAANYRTAGMLYGPRGGPFPHAGEEFGRALRQLKRTEQHARGPQLEFGAAAVEHRDDALRMRAGKLAVDHLHALEGQTGRRIAVRLDHE